MIGSRACGVPKIGMHFSLSLQMSPQQSQHSWLSVNNFFFLFFKLMEHFQMSKTRNLRIHDQLPKHSMFEVESLDLKINILYNEVINYAPRLGNYRVQPRDPSNTFNVSNIWILPRYIHL